MCELAVGYRDTIVHVSVFIINMAYTHAACTFQIVLKLPYCKYLILTEEYI
jgi:hypothetical protein